MNKSKTDAGKFIADFVSVEIVNNPAGFQVFDRENLNSIVEAKKLMAEGYIDAEKTMELGKILSVEAIIIGNYTLLSNSLSLTLKALDVNSGFVIAASMNDLTLDSDAGMVLGINTAASGGISNVNNSNRGFNNVPLNSNENYNNPETVNKSCETRNTGDFCFKNGTNVRLKVTIYAVHDNSDKECSDRNMNSIILEVGETKCLYGLYSCVANYYVVKESKGGMNGMWFPISTSDRYTQGQIMIEKCKSKTLEIK
ncbi:MAG: hypothetical protein IPO49_09910 [Bacteroidetes bacterium]|nr:hypothetical protein [Bacteroidota bacterium]